MSVLRQTPQKTTSISCRITAVILYDSQGKFNSFNKPSAVSVKHSTALAWISPQDQHILLARSTRLHNRKNYNCLDYYFCLITSRLFQKKQLNRRQHITHSNLLIDTYYYIFIDFFKDRLKRLIASTTTSYIIHFVTSVI